MTYRLYNIYILPKELCAEVHDAWANPAFLFREIPVSSHVTAETRDVTRTVQS